MPDYESNVKKNLQTNIDRLEKTGDEVKKKIRNYKDMIRVLRKLNDMTDARYKLEEKMPGIPLSAEDRKSFEEVYRQAVHQCEKYLAENKDIKDQRLKPVNTIVQSVLNDLAKDLSVITARSRDGRPASLHMIMNESRVPEIDLGDEELGTVGSAMSRRIPFQYTMPDGQKLSGVFTPKSFLDSRQMLNQAVNDAVQDHPEFRPLFEELYPVYLQAVQKEDRPENRRKFFSRLIGDYREARKQMKLGEKKDYCFNRLLAFYKKRLGDNLEKNIGKDGLKEAVYIFFEDAAKFHNTLGINAEAGIEENSRIDSRNSAMSAVADLLGMPDLLARSVPLKIHYKGAVLEGTFMAKGRGMDLNAPTKASLSYTAENFQTNGLKSVSDLMILDYICGNIDRHAGNVLYKFDAEKKNPKAHRFLGLQGIDNDCSFGTMVPAEDQERNRMAALTDIRYMSESTAQAILSLRPEILKLKLREMDLSDAQVQAAVQRLNKMQKRIEETRDPASELLGFSFNKQMMTIIPDDAFGGLDLNELQNDGLLFNVLQSFKQHLDSADVGQDTLKMKEVNSIHGFRMDDQERKRTENTLKQLADATNYRGTSEAFEKLRRAVSTYRDFCIANQNEVLSTAEYEQRNRYLQKIAAAADSYLQGKKNLPESKRSRYTKKRMDAVEKIMNAYAEEARKNWNLYDELNDPGTKESVRQLQDEYEQQEIDRLNAKVRAEMMNKSLLQMKETTRDNLRRNLEALQTHAGDDKQYEKLTELLNKHCTAFLMSRMNNPQNSRTYSMNLRRAESPEGRELQALQEGIRDPKTQQLFRDTFRKVLDGMKKLYPEETEKQKPGTVIPAEEKVRIPE